MVLDVLRSYTPEDARRSSVPFLVLVSLITSRRTAGPEHHFARICVHPAGDQEAPAHCVNTATNAVVTVNVVTGAPIASSATCTAAGVAQGTTFVWHADACLSSSGDDVSAENPTQDGEEEPPAL